MHPIRVASEKSKLSPHVIRMWERRYQAISPKRSESGQRIYADVDVNRLCLLNDAVRAGHTIGRIAKLPDNELLQLNASDYTRNKDPSENHFDMVFVERCIFIIKQLQPDEFQSELQRTALLYSHEEFIRRCVQPLMQRIGELWHDGQLSIAAEHIASLGIRSFVEEIRSSIPVNEDAPVMLVATPVGQMHEIGALFVATMACIEGWRSSYLGRDIPTEAIVHAAEQLDAVAVAISIVYTPEPDAVFEQMRMLRKQLNSDIALVVGGAGQRQFKNKFREIPAIQLDDLNQMRPLLANITQGTSSQNSVSLQNIK